MDWAADIVYVSPLLRLIPNELIYTCLPPPTPKKPPKKPRELPKKQQNSKNGEKDSPWNISSKV